MQIENFRIWHWMITGVIVGLLFSVVQNFQGPWFDNAPLETIDPSQLDWTAMYDLRPPNNYGRGVDTLRREKPYIDAYHNGQPMLKDLVVHPAPTTDKSGQWWVTGKYFVADEEKDPKDPSKPVIVGKWMPFKSPATAPYFPMYHSSHLLKVQDELNGLLAEQAKDKAEGKEFPEDKFRGILQRQDEVRRDADLQKAIGGKDSTAPDSFANVGDFLKYAQTREPDRKFKYSVAFWDSRVGIWTLPPVAGFFLIGLGMPLLINILQAFGLAPVPAPRQREAPKPTPAPKAAPASRPVPVTAAAVQVVTPAPQRPMTEAEKKQYGGEYYPVVKTTHKD